MAWRGGGHGNLELYRRLDLINIIMSQVGLIDFDIMAKQAPKGRDGVVLHFVIHFDTTKEGAIECTATQPPNGRDGVVPHFVPHFDTTKMGSVLSGYQPDGPVS